RADGVFIGSCRVDADKYVRSEIASAAWSRPIVTRRTGVCVRSCCADHAGLRRSGLTVGSGCRPALAVEFVEDGHEQHLSIFHDVLKRNASTFNVGLIYMNRHGRSIADLLREQRSAGNNNGTQGE